MHTDLSRVYVDDKRARLREAAQTPTPTILTRLWALLRRREEPERVLSLPARDVERLAA
jgi:hypothetical protein